MSDAIDETGAAPRQLRDRFTFLLIIAATFGLQALTLVTGVIIARVLGVEGRGVVALVFAVGLFASQLTFGSSLPVAIAKNLAERGIATREGFARIARRRAALLLVPSVAAGVLMLLISPSEEVIDPRFLAASAFLMTLQTMVFRVISGGLQGEGRLVRVATVALMPQLLFTVALVVALVADLSWSAAELLAAYFVTSLLGVAYAFGSLLRPTGRAVAPLDERELWVESRRSYLSSVRPLDGLQIDRIVVGSVISTLALGLYAAAAAVSNLCSLVSNAVAVVVLPRVAMHQHDPTSQRAVIRRWVGLAAVLIVVTVAGLEVIVDPVIRLAFGEEFAGAIACARWLIVADGFMAMRKVLIAVLQGQGRGGTASWAEVTVLPVMIAAIAVAAAQESLVAIAVCLTGAGLVSCLWLGLAVARTPLARPVSS